MLEYVIKFAMSTLKNPATIFLCGIFTNIDGRFFYSRPQVIYIQTKFQKHFTPKIAASTYISFLSKHWKLQKIHSSVTVFHTAGMERQFSGRRMNIDWIILNNIPFYWYLSKYLYLIHLNVIEDEIGFWLNPRYTPPSRNLECCIFSFFFF